MSWYRKQEPIPAKSRATAVVVSSGDEIALENRREGRGTGLAKAAELDESLEPARVLEVAKELGLTPTQVEKARILQTILGREAKELGERITTRERDLASTGSRVEAGTAEALIAEIGNLQGTLRSSHLRASQKMMVILTPEQIQKYGRLRRVRKWVSPTGME